MTNELLTPTQWDDYELIDSGNYEKLERFGPYITARPEPQALWDKSLSESEWEHLAHATFRKEYKSEDRGQWYCKPGVPQQWPVSYHYKGMKLRLKLSLTAFKHVGLFPEQAENWNYIYDSVETLCKEGLKNAREAKDAEKTPSGLQHQDHHIAETGDTNVTGTYLPQNSSRTQSAPSVQVLNLFAYTGGASLAARSAGAEVTHVDSVRQVVGWARENMELSALDNIRWMVDDALKFVKREVKRGRHYQGILLDPPAYGRGPDGEKWILEEHVTELLKNCATLLEPHGFLVFNLYSMGLSALLAKTLSNQIFGKVANESFGELYVTDRTGKSLPLGVYYRFFR